MNSFTSWRIVVFAISMAISAFAGNSFRFNDDSLQFAAIIHRHGDRSPLKTYPNDPHNNYSWPGGRGALSALGSLQLYTLGQNLRQRYFRLLPADGLYSAEHMQVLSSERERTLMSSQSFLAGFMPPNDRNPLPITWQPISIHSIPPDMDTFILQETPCPKYLHTYLHLSQHPPPEFRKFYEEYAEWFAYLTNHTGMSVTRAEEALIVWDILLVEHNNSLTLPAWTEAIFPERLRAMAEMGLLIPLQTPYMRLHRGGPIVSRIVGQMREKRNGIAPNRSLYIYSAHDSTLLSITRLLNLTDQTTGLPNYGATLAFELHCAGKDNCGQMEVKIVYYFEYTDKKPKQLAIPNCPVPCTLDRFTESINEILNYDYVNMCKLDGDSVMNGESSESDLQTLNRN